MKNASMKEVLIRPATLEDEPTLWTMLMHAAHESSLAAVKTNPALVRYVQGWGRTGDVGAVAEVETVAVGAAWVRLWAEGDQGYGYVSAEIPELAIAVVLEQRGQGVGTALLAAIIQVAQSQFPAISLSIRADNPALRLYERTGFVPVPGSEVINRTGGRSFTMIYHFDSPC